MEVSNAIAVTVEAFLSDQLINQAIIVGIQWDSVLLQLQSGHSLQDIVRD